MNLNQAYGLSRSLAVYYGRPWKAVSMLRLYSQFISKGDLAFDVGSHVGNRAMIWSILGARVIAIEPQKLFSGFLNILFANNPRVSVLKLGLGEVSGFQRIHVSDKTPTVSSIQPKWCEDVRADPRFCDIKWNRDEGVEVKTLEDLICEFGKPKFCKIDVEGNELAVLCGLQTVIDALSFEYLPILKNAAIKCIEKVESLHSYEYNWSETESMSLKSSAWLSPDEMIQKIEVFRPDAKSGDIYARKLK